jgi:ABC-type oligopeptide transport system ATPase subunit
VLVGPYPPRTLTAAASTGIFEGSVGNPTRVGLARYAATNVTIIVFDLAISSDYVMTDGHNILKVLYIKGNFT